MSISIEPQGDITLVKCPLESDYKNTFTFANITDQTTYFNGLTGKKVLGTDYTYIRKDGMVSVPFPIDEIINYNYLFYNNKGFTTKRYYCFIDRMEYINENCTHIFFHTDVFQTWYFDLTWNRCYVEREHVNDDTTGLNLVPEGLETGEYICAGVNDVTGISTSRYICAGVTYDFLGQGSTFRGNYYGGIFSGLQYYAFQTSGGIETFLNAADAMGRADAIQCLFMVPKELINPTNIADNTFFASRSITVDNTTYTFNAAIPSGTNSATKIGTSVSIARPTTFGTYTPKNNKMYTYPYMYFLATNNSGNETVFHYEDFLTPSSPSFDTIGVLAPGCSMITIPRGYRDIADSTSELIPTIYKSFNYGISLPKYPICSWNSDVYTNWLTQQSVNLSNQAIRQGIGILKAAGNFAGKLLGSGSPKDLGKAAKGFAQDLESPMYSIMNTQAAMYEHSLISPTLEGNMNCGDVTYAASYYKGIDCHKMQIKEPMARIIDNFFSMYGYKVNITKIPNITGRTYWNYIKTIGCNVEGDIPQEDLETIRSVCDSGITFWHDTSKMYHYELTNSIVSP